MRGLSDIRGMEAVVVRYVSMVMVLQGHHISDKGVDRDAERLQQLSLLRWEDRRQKFTHPLHRQVHQPTL